MAIPSLAMIPSGYKDGKVYSVLPSNGDGDFTFSRGSNATRVNKDGLIETMPLGLGSELITNGGFDTDSDWTKGTGWTISGGKAVSNSSVGFQGLSQSNAISNSNGKTFKCNFTISGYSSGTVALYISGFINNSYFVGADGDYEIHITVSQGTSGNVEFLTNSSGFVGSIDNVSVKEVISGYDLPRLDYSDSSCPSLLLEPQRTNLVTYSEAFDNSYWTKSGATVTGGFTSPDGTNNAYKLVEGTNNGEHTVYKLNVSISSGVNYTYSVFVKGTERVLQMVISSNFSSNFCNFDLSDGTIGSNSGLVDSNITSFSNGWYRCDITALSNGTSANLELILAESKTSSRYTTYQGDGSSGVEIYGAQLEEGSYATSYIPTNGQTATRLADVCIESGNSEVFNSQEGVLFLDTKALSNDGTTRTIGLSDGSNSNRIHFIYYSTTNGYSVNYRVSGSTQVAFTKLGNILDYQKIAFKYKSGDFSLWYNGFEIDTDNNTNMMAQGVLNTLSFREEPNSFNYTGKTKQVQYYNSVLTDSEIEELTSWESFIQMANGQNYTIK